MAQVSTEHPTHRNRPCSQSDIFRDSLRKLADRWISCRGRTRSRNLRRKPEGDRPYLEDLGFLDRVQLQFDEIAGAKGLPETLEKKYDAEIAYIDDLKKRANGRTKGERNGYSKLQCSLVKSIGPIPIPGVKTFGNIIFIPDFGTVSLAEVEVGIEASYDGFFGEIGNGSPQGPATATTSH